MNFREIAEKILTRLFPEFTNKLTWVVVISGLTLVSSSLVEQVLRQVISETLSWRLTDGSDGTIGVILVALGLLHNYGYVREKRKSEMSVAGTTQSLGHPNDIELFKQFCALLPSTGPIEFLKQHDFLIDFNGDYVEPFKVFLNEWENEEHAFLDSDLEEFRVGLLKSVNSMLLKIAEYTTINRAGLVSVRTDNLRHDPQHEERFRKEASIINLAADEVIKQHQALIKRGRAKLDLV